MSQVERTVIEKFPYMESQKACEKYFGKKAGRAFWKLASATEKNYLERGKKFVRITEEIALNQIDPLAAPKALLAMMEAEVQAFVTTFERSLIIQNPTKPHLERVRISQETRKIVSGLS